VLENENENLDIPTPEVKKEREKQIKVRFVGLIIAVRKVQTKTGKLMGIATCEGVGINFTMVVFPKDYEVFGPLLVEDQVAIVEGYFKGNTLSGEISVVVQTLKTHAITALRTLAQEMGLFDRNHRVRGTLVRGSLTSDPGEVFILEVPRGASRQDLIDLKSYLVSIPGNQAVSIKLGGEVADTKLRVSDVALVKEWGERRWTMMK
jgi:DNA polymerase III alpha subunit